jgi:hypothetical protein
VKPRNQFSSAQKIAFSQKLCNELEIQFSYATQRNESGVKLLEEKNSSIAKELGFSVATVRKVFLAFPARWFSDTDPGDQAVFWSL